MMQVARPVAGNPAVIRVRASFRDHCKLDMCMAYEKDPFYFEASNVQLAVSFRYSLAQRWVP
jgi:hypothetical protein